MATDGDMQPQHEHTEGCCQNNDGKCSDKLPTIFDVVKSGMLLPFQTYVEGVGADCLKEKDERGNSVCHWACLGGNTTMLRHIIEMKGPIDDAGDNELGQRPIHWACVNGHVAVVDILLQAGVNIDALDAKGYTPLIVACQYGKTVLSGYLLGRGASLKLTDSDGDTPLHWACFKGFSELSRLLIYSGFNPHQRDHYGQTALHLACISGDLTCVKELCEQDDVQLDIRDKNDKTPLMLAAGRRHQRIIAYLKKRARKSYLPKIDFKTIVFGPPGNSKLPLVFFLFNMLCFGYPVYIIKCLPMTWNEFEMLHLFFMGLNAVMWVCLYHASTIDPGYLPRNVPEYDRAIKEVAHYDEWKHGRNPLNRLCHTCRTVKPLRSKHCRICNRCVHMFDHHCPYIYNCVGNNNRVYFFVFTAVIYLMALIGGYFCLYMLKHGGFDIYVVVGALPIIFAVFVAGCVNIFTMFQVIANLTTNERINWKRYEYLKDGKGKYYNPFNRGALQNILEFFHLRRMPSQEEIDLLNVEVI